MQCKGLDNVVYILVVLVERLAVWGGPIQADGPNNTDTADCSTLCNVESIMLAREVKHIMVQWKQAVSAIWSILQNGYKNYCEYCCENHKILNENSLSSIYRYHV